MSDITTTLEARGQEYGLFAGHAMIAQQLKEIVRTSPAYPSMSDAERESLDMLMHKIARICNGNPHHVDSWHDIAGYATLVERQLNGNPI